MRSVAGVNGYRGGDSGRAVLVADGKANAGTAGHVGAVPLHNPHGVGGSGERVIAAGEGDGGTFNYIKNNGSTQPM